MLCCVSVHNLCGLYGRFIVTREALCGPSWRYYLHAEKFDMIEDNNF